MTRNVSKQFAAVFVLRISVAHDPRIVTRFETYLFEAMTTDDAYQQATEYGPRLDYEYRNSDGEIVTIKCLGIHELDHVEPDGEGYRGIVSSVEFLTANVVEPYALIKDRNHLACFGQHKAHPDFPNLDQ